MYDYIWLCFGSNYIVVVVLSLNEDTITFSIDIVTFQSNSLNLGLYLSINIDLNDIVIKETFLFLFENKQT